MKPSNTITSGKATDMIAGICTFPRLPCPCTKRHVMRNLTSTRVCNTGTTALYVCNMLLWLTWWWMLLYRTLRKVTSTNMRKNMYVVTPRCAAAAVVSAVVLRRPTKEYTHPYSIMHRRLPTAGTEIALHYHQLLEVLWVISVWVIKLLLFIEDSGEDSCWKYLLALTKLLFSKSMYVCTSYVK